MKFIDEITITVSSGSGGAGASSFRRERFLAYGGPDGGDGGDGGSVFFIADSSLNSLYHLRGKKYFRAKDGAPGGNKRKFGKKGQDIEIKLPVGSVIKDIESKEVLLEILNEDDKILFLKGGKGGLGNWHFKNSINQAPKYSQPGLEGKTLEIFIELKSVADLGLLGFPNAGKSSFVSAVSNARPKVADYPFTTLTPSLGIVELNRYTSFVVADIPGIIEGAHKGVGLGIKFLKHIERTKFFLYVIEYNPYNELSSLFEQFKTLRAELLKYKESLGKRPFAIAISKCDLVVDDSVYEGLKEVFSEFNDKLFFISSFTKLGLDATVKHVFQKIQEDLNSF